MGTGRLHRTGVLVAALTFGLAACGAVPDAGVTVVATAPVGADTDNAGDSGDASPTSATAPGTQAPGETHDVIVTGTPLPSLDDTTSAPDPGLGLVPPTLDGQTFNGNPVSITPGVNDHFQLVFFFAHWCPHCRREVPRLVSWLKAGSKPANLDVLAVSTAVNRSPVNYPPSDWFAREELDVPIMTDDGDGLAAAAWGLPGYPYAVMLKPDGTVAARIAGEFTDIAAFDAWVRASMAAGTR